VDDITGFTEEKPVRVMFLRKFRGKGVMVIDRIRFSVGRLPKDWLKRWRV